MSHYRDYLRVCIWSGALLTFGISASWAVAEAQAQSPRWGSIPDEEWEIDAYAADSSASALILGEIGELHFRNDLSVVYDVHRRVKVFTEAGYDLATVEVVFVHARRSQRLDRVQGQTFLRGADGRVQRIRLESSDIHREEDGNLMRVRFTLPAMEPGAIFEYRYRLRSDRPYLPDWRFQDREPALWSEFRVEIPRFLTVRRHFIGEPRFAVAEVEELPFSLARLQSSIASGANRAARVVDTNNYRWAMANVPALRDEEFIASVLNHAYAVRFDLSGYYDVYGVHNPLSETWEQVGKGLMESDYFGRHLRPTRALRRHVENLTAGLDDQTEVMRRLYDYVRGGITWTEQYRFGASGSLDRVLEARRGTSGEVNLLLLAMLRAAGVRAEPVLVSTRRNGWPVAWFASSQQFNHVVVRVEFGDDAYMLDATDPHRPIDMLPPAALNVEGWLLSEDRFGWVPLVPASGTMNALNLSGSIEPDGTITGMLQGRVAGYAALDMRRRLARSSDDDERGRAVGQQAQFAITEVEMDGLDGDGPIQYEARFAAPEHARPMAHLLTFNPIILQRLERNPFIQPERAYPVDFAYPRMHSFTAELAIPAGYEIDELPDPVQLALPGNAAAYQRLVTQAGDGLRIQRALAVRATAFPPEEYSMLREFYDRVASADAEVVVLVRSDDSIREAVNPDDEEEEG